MNQILLYHYATIEKYKSIIKKEMLIPSAPFNSRIPENEWSNYIRQFSFPIAHLYTYCFFEPDPQSWRDYGLFELLMEEFAGGDYLLELSIFLELEEERDFPILVRDHVFHSPKSYGKLPKEWKRREVRDSRPDLRNAWYQSTTPLRDYDSTFICPEILIPFTISLDKIKATGGRDGKFH